MAKPWRPHIDDVDRLSRGEGAKRRGTGSFHIPHRLSADERPVYDSSKKKGYLSVRGSGGRKAHARHGHPLPNSFRQFCDAKGRPCVVIEQDRGGQGLDIVVVDLSPLRLLDPGQVEARCCDAAAELGLRRLAPEERGPEDVPFDVNPVALPQAASQQPGAPLEPPADAAPGGAGGGSRGGVESLAEVEAAVEAQGRAVRALKESGMTNQDSAVQAGVQELLRLKRRLAELQEQQQGHGPSSAPDDTASTSSSSGVADDNADSGAGSSDDEGGAASSSGGDSDAGSSSGGGGGGGKVKRDVLEDDHPYATVAIWQLAPRPLFFEGTRTVAKEFAKRVAADGGGGGGKRQR